MNAANILDGAMISRSARAEVVSFENEKARRERSRLLTPEEQGDLWLEWGGYDTALSSCRSALGPALDNARRRAEPKERPVRAFVVAELERHGRPLAVDDVVRVLIGEKAGEKGLYNDVATANEVRLAIRGMVGAGLAKKYIQDMPRSRERIGEDGKPVRETYHAPTEMIALLPQPSWRCPEPLAPEERWRRQDEDLRRYCEGYVLCQETQAARRIEGNDITISSVGSQPRGARWLTGKWRQALEAYYGSMRGDRVKLSRADVFGDMAPVVPFTDILETERQRADHTRRIRSTPAEVLRGILDIEPESRESLAAWRERRIRFIECAKREAKALLEEACEMFRAARRW